MALRRLTLTRGDNQTYTLTFKESDGTLYDISGWTIYFTLKQNKDDTDAQAVLQLILTAGAADSDHFGVLGATGVGTITLLPVDTTNLTPMEYDFDIQVRTNLNAVYTVLKGKLDLGYDVSRSSTAGT